MGLYETARVTMNVVGHNIANVNTIGYKSQRMDFQDMFYKNIFTASGLEQMGMGARVGTILTDFSQGSMEQTGMSTDLAIQGKGYFKVNVPGQNNSYYTRAGDFSFNKEGELVNPQGYILQGWKVTDSSGPTVAKASSTTVAAPKTTTILGSGVPVDIKLDSWSVLPKATDRITTYVNLSSSSSDNSTWDINPFAALFNTWDGKIQNPDGSTYNRNGQAYLAESAYAYQSSIKIYDEAGVAHTATVYFDKVDQSAYDGGKSSQNVWEYIVTINPAEDNRMFWDPSANGGTGGVIDIKTTNMAGILMTGTMTYGSNGDLLDLSSYTLMGGRDTWLNDGKINNNGNYDLDAKYYRAVYTHPQTQAQTYYGEPLGAGWVPGVTTFLLDGKTVTYGGTEIPPAQVNNTAFYPVMDTSTTEGATLTDAWANPDATGQPIATTKSASLNNAVTQELLPDIPANAAAKTGKPTVPMTSNASTTLVSTTPTTVLPGQPLTTLAQLSYAVQYNGAAVPATVTIKQGFTVTGSNGVPYGDDTIDHTYADGSPQFTAIANALGLNTTTGAMTNPGACSSLYTYTVATHGGAPNSDYAVTAGGKTYYGSEPIADPAAVIALSGGPGAAAVTYTQLVQPYVVNDGYQVTVGGKTYVGGTSSAAITDPAAVTTLLGGGGTAEQITYNIGADYNVTIGGVTLTASDNPITNPTAVLALLNKNATATQDIYEIASGYEILDILTGTTYTGSIPKSVYDNSAGTLIAQHNVGNQTALMSWYPAAVSTSGYPLMVANFTAVEQAHTAGSPKGGQHLIEMDFGITVASLANPWMNMYELDAKGDPDPSKPISLGATRAHGGSFADGYDPDVQATWANYGGIAKINGTPTLGAERCMVSGAASSSTTRTNQNGYTYGSLMDIYFDQGGVMYGIYSNGVTNPLYQVVLYDFVSPQNLRFEGGNLISQTMESGDPSWGAAGVNGFGTVNGYMIEQSNVDLAEEIVRMITTQRGYQANSKTITTVDTMLEVTVNMKR